MISEIIEKWIKGILIDGITGNLSGLFDNVNAKVGEIASDVGSTPQAWNSGIFNMLRSLSETVVLPIAAAILALVMCHELNLFQSERVIIGKCPRCSENVYEGKKNFYCGNRSCQFVMWKNDRFFEQRKKAFTPKIAAALLKNGKAKVKGLYSEKTGKTYDATVLLADTGGKYVNYRVERKE